MSEKVTIALLGQPNSGKSTLFNALTGLHQHVGNWPGKTVEKKEGTFSYGGREYELADLPGSYSLSANSDEEVITRDFIASGKADVVCILTDSSQLERSLFMAADYAGITVPCILILNMADVAAAQGKKIDAGLIEQKLGVPVVLFSANDKKGYAPFYNALERAVAEKKTLDTTSLEALYAMIPGYSEVKNLMPEDLIPAYSPMWLAAKTLENDPVVIAKLKNTLDTETVSRIDGYRKGVQGAVETGGAKFSWMLASELHTTPADIRRKLEFLENAGIIKRISFTAASCGGGSCSSCTGCSPNAGNDPGGRKGKSSCSGCIPGAELMNMGEMWEVVG